MTGIWAKSHRYVEETQHYQLGKELECAEQIKSSSLKQSLFSKHNTNTEIQNDGSQKSVENQEYSRTEYHSKSYKASYSAQNFIHYCNVHHLQRSEAALQHMPHGQMMTALSATRSSLWERELQEKNKAAVMNSGGIFGFKLGMCTCICYIINRRTSNIGRSAGTRGFR